METMPKNKKPFTNACFNQQIDNSIPATGSKKPGQRNGLKLTIRERLSPHDLFNSFTADIIREKTVFTR
jgi:hypothetical protein